MEKPAAADHTRPTRGNRAALGLLESGREIVAAIDHMAKRGPGGHVVQVVDPAEETFPYSGRIDFRERRPARI